MPGATRATNTVDKGHWIIWYLVVDDVSDIIDVDTAGSNIGGDQDVYLAGAEGLQGFLAGLLPKVAVDGSHAEAAPGEIIGQMGGRSLGTGEDDGAPAVGSLQGVRDDGNLIHAVSLEGDLAGGGMSEILLARFGADMDGLIHKTAGQR